MSYQSLWNLTYSKLKESLPDHAINTWFEPVVPIAIADGELILEVPNQFFYEWIDSHYRQNISGALDDVANERMRYRFIVSKQGQKKELEDQNSSTTKNNSKTFSQFVSSLLSIFALRIWDPL